MKAIHIGAIIKRRRLELGLTQEQLCEGICEPPTMSRIEKGYQTPTYSKLKALLSRINLPSEKYYAMLSENELEIEQLKDEIVDCNSRGLCREGLERIDQLLLLVDEDDPVTQQFIARSRVALGKLEHGEVVSYSAEEKLDLLFKAIKMTIPSFELNKIEHHWYSLDEVKVINQIGTVYGDNNQRDKATEIYAQLMKLIKKKLTVYSGNFPTAILVAYNYCLYLSQEGRYDEALEVAHWGWDKSVEWSCSGCLGGLLFVIGKCLYCTGKQEDSIDYFVQSYYVFKAMRNVADTEAVRQDIKEYLGISL